MGTPIQEIYRKFLGMIEDEEWLLVDEDVIEDLMLNYLENATVEFHQCKKDLTIDYDRMCFVEELGMNEVMILAWGMVIHYLQPKIKREENLRQFISDKDFNKLSNANMLMRLMNLEEKARKQLDTYQSRYRFKEFTGWN
jgi:hypothetical protein